MTHELTAPAALAPVHYRGTWLDQVGLAAIQSIVDAQDSPGITEVALRVCAHFGWTRANGRAPHLSCVVFLRRLAESGRLRLPEQRRRVPRGRGLADDHLEFLRALGPVQGFPECQPDGPLEVRPIAPEEYAGFRLHLQRFHYLGFEKPSGESLCYAALVGNELVALLVWGAAVRLNKHRDQFVGWDYLTRERKLLYVVNNTRFLILPWIRQRCLASRILGANVRRLSGDWERTYGHPVWLAETFVDIGLFKGTCYRASNWQYLGQTQGFSRSRRDPRGFIRHGRPKAIFVLPLHRRALAQLRGPQPGTAVSVGIVTTSR